MEAGTEGAGGGIVFRPEVGASYSNAWRQLWKNFPILLGIWILYLIIGSVFSAISLISGGLYSTGYSIWDWLGIIYSIFIVTPIGLGMFYAYLKAARGEKPELSDMFSGFSNYLSAVFAPILTAIIVVIGFFLLIVPGIIFACKLAFVPLLVVEYKMNPFDAISESWRMTDGYAMEVFLIGLLSIPISIAGLICFGVGIIVAYMWVYLAMASLYHAITLDKGKTVVQPRM